jgi:epidermal growth factor receptor substrate 15
MNSAPTSANTTAAIVDTADADVAGTTAIRGGRSIFKGANAAQLLVSARPSLSASSGCSSTVAADATSADNGCDWPPSDPILTSLLSAASEEEQYAFNTAAASRSSVHATTRWPSSSSTNTDIATDMMSETDDDIPDLQCSSSKRARTEGCCTGKTSVRLAASAAPLRAPVAAVIAGLKTLPDTAVGSNAHTQMMAGLYDAAQQTPSVATAAHSVYTGAYTSRCSTSTSSASSVASIAADSYCSTATMASAVEVLSNAAATASTSISMPQLYIMSSGDHVTCSLTLLKLSTEAGDCTESNRSQQVRSIVREWNAGSQADVAVKLELLSCWRKCGHIDESSRSEQAKLAWNSYVHCKLA